MLILQLSFARCSVEERCFPHAFLPHIGLPQLKDVARGYPDQKPYLYHTLSTPKTIGFQLY